MQTGMDRAITIALPTHRLKEEVSERLNRLGCKHVKVHLLFVLIGGFGVDFGRGIGEKR